MINIIEQDYENVRNFTDDVIDRFAEACEQPFGWDQFAFEALDNGERVGAIVGYRLYDWLYVEYIVVREDSRGEGVGIRLLERAETLARELALDGVALDTFRYQAPAYYAARDYIEHMVIPGKTRERDRIYFQKKLDGK
ncbi:GNAT family N-acetyltransferase [Gammaproteobacteria bacterium]|nr:GNAT family N-acetyltransferase [Gammaproteobacteria bacterium]